MSTRDEQGHDPGRTRADRLHALILSALLEPEHDRIELRDAVCDYAYEERETSFSPERTLIDLKREITRAAAERVTYAVCNALIDDVVRWFIDAFYEPAPERMVIHAPARRRRPYLGGTSSFGDTTTSSAR